MTDPYLIPNTDVLKNKLGITDKNELNKAESFISQTKLLNVDEVKGNFDYKHLMDIHKHILGDVYAWAGEPRILDMQKREQVLSGMSVQYGHHKDIPEEINKSIDGMKSVKWNELKTYDEKAEAFSDHLSKLWKVHPFREGNTRTTTEFCMQYAESQGISFDRELIAKESGYFRNALVLNSIGEYSEPKYLNRIVKDSMQRGDELKEKSKEKKQDIFSMKGLKEIDSQIKSEPQKEIKDRKQDRSDR